MSQTRLKSSQVKGAVNKQSGASYTLAHIDDGGIVLVQSELAHTTTVPTNTAVPLRVGAEVLLVQGGVGEISIVAASGVTVTSVEALSLTAVGSFARLRKTGLNEWSCVISGSGLGEDAGGPGETGGDYYDEIMARAGLDTYLRFDEVSPATAFDSSGNGNHATYSGGFTLGEAPIVDGGSASVLLNGGELINSGYTFTDGDWTIEVWTNFVGLPNGAALWFIGRAGSFYDAHRTLLGFADGTEDGYSPGGNYPFIGSVNGDLNNWEIAAADSAVVTGADYHFVTTWSASDAVLSLWINKALTRTLPLYESINYAELHIGRRPDDGGNNDDINARLDEFVIVNRVITEQEIVDANDIGTGAGIQPPLPDPPAPSTYAALIAAKSPVAWYPCDELVPKACFDASGNGETGQYLGGITFQDPPIVDGGKNIATLNGADGYIRTFSTPFAEEDEFSVEVFFELDTTPNGEGIWSFHNTGISYSGQNTVYPRILTLGCCNGVNPMTPGGNTLYLRMATPQYFNSEGYVYNIITDVLVTAGVKNHAVIVFDKRMVGSSQYSRMRLYVNGVLKGEHDGIYFKSARYGFSVGRRIDDMGNRNYAHGRIHSAVYASVFTASDVTDHYNAAMGI